MNINYEFDTISAIATPFAIGGIGVIRISGTKSLNIIKKIFTGKISKPDKITHGWIKSNDKLIDEVIVLYFKAPKSFTGEDVVEIQAHGSLNVLKMILDLTIKNGARLAERGEFSKRAFLNGKIDLSQAESILDLIHSKTQHFATLSAQNLSGKLQAEIKIINKILFDLLSKIVASIDFPEDVAEVSYDIINKELNSALEKITKILQNAKSSNIMRQGVKVAIVGRPNVGKSSLFNNLLNLQRAIVTDIAGTTRDTLQETIDIAGIPITLIDTAGIRENKNLNEVEKIGINFSKQAIENADLTLFIYDGKTGMQKADSEIFKLIKNLPHIKIASKADLLTEKNDKNSLYISNETQENIDLLKNKIADYFTTTNTSENEFMTNSRQQNCLIKAKDSVILALEGTKNQELQDLISIDIKSAVLALNELSGEVITDDILNNIFDNFCIGK